MTQLPRTDGKVRGRYNWKIKPWPLLLHAPVPHRSHPTQRASVQMERERHLRGMIPWLTSSSRVRRCWSFNCSTTWQQREDRCSQSAITTADAFSNADNVQKISYIVKGGSQTATVCNCRSGLTARVSAFCCGRQEEVAKGLAG